MSRLGVGLAVFSAAVAGEAVRSSDAMTSANSAALQAFQKEKVEEENTVDRAGRKVAAENVKAAKDAETAAALLQAASVNQAGREAALANMQSAQAEQAAATLEKALPNMPSMVREILHKPSGRDTSSFQASFPSYKSGGVDEDALQVLRDPHEMREAIVRGVESIQEGMEAFNHLQGIHKATGHTDTLENAIAQLDPLNAVDAAHGFPFSNGGGGHSSVLQLEKNDKKSSFFQRRSNAKALGKSLKANELDDKKALPAKTYDKNLTGWADREDFGDLIKPRYTGHPLTNAQFKQKDIQQEFKKAGDELAWNIAKMRAHDATATAKIYNTYAFLHDGAPQGLLGQAQGR